MEIAAAALVSLLVGVGAAVLLGNPLWILVAIIVGALAANRAGYRHQGRAIRSEFDRSGASTAATLRPGVDDRLAELDGLRAAGRVNDEEYATARARILGEL